MNIVGFCINVLIQVFLRMRRRERKPHRMITFRAIKGELSHA